MENGEWKMENNQYDIADLEACLQVLRAGGIVLYPTDTVWGIGCDATNAQAVQQIYRLKQRSDSKSMLVLLADEAELSRYVSVPACARIIIEESAREATARPLTIIYPEAHSVAENLIAEDGSLGIRLTSEAFTQALCRRLGRPVVSTSANISGCPAAKTYSQISEAIRQGVDYICRYRREDETEKMPSKIVKVTSEGEVTIIRD
jgi:L-threonylcarbamoyladenylate synthase